MTSTDDSLRACYLNEMIFSTLLLLFTVWRYNKTSSTKISSYKSRLRSVGSFFITSSIFSTCMCNIIIWYLSGYIKLDKYKFERDGFINQTFNLTYKDVQINLCTLLYVVYMISKILRMSAVFMLIGLWGPCLHSYINTERYDSTYIRYSIFDSKNLFKTSIVTFSKLYSVFRIPVLIFLYFNLKELNPSTTVFFESLFLSAEIYFCLGLFLVLQTKHNFLIGYKGVDTISLLSMCLGIYGFLNYTINSLTFPFVVSPTSRQVVQSLVFGLRLIIDILIVNMFCPLNGQVFDEVENRKEKGIEFTSESRDIILYQ
ncbi:hypothetical protein NCER_100795 [Vairimorpha ceranae BRL01]|uniref:Uncharacterized protein n=1 Tax=Vairimorpha ceranae (strain BRL01) TaxID=578460 RepID=C4V8G9_VAIC1|nr:hypothetical protein NCER_100795 [Vairimorpha ceranae BRL01]